MRPHCWRWALQQGESNERSTSLVGGYRFRLPRAGERTAPCEAQCVTCGPSGCEALPPMSQGAYTCTFYVYPDGTWSCSTGGSCVPAGGGDPGDGEIMPVKGHSATLGIPQDEGVYAQVSSAMIFEIRGAAPTAALGLGNHYQIIETTRESFSPAEAASAVARLLRLPRQGVLFAGATTIFGNGEASSAFGARGGDRYEISILPDGASAHVFVTNSFGGPSSTSQTAATLAANDVLLTRVRMNQRDYVLALTSVVGSMSLERGAALERIHSASLVGIRSYDGPRSTLAAVGAGVARRASTWGEIKVIYR